MRYIYRFLLIGVISLLGLLAQAQYISPGNHLSLSLDDLVSASGGVISYHENAYQINAAFTLSATDTLRINEAAIIRIATGIRPEFYGTLISDPANGQVHFTAIDTSSISTNFKGLRFSDSPANLMRNTIVSYGGGIQLISSEALFEYCTFRHNGSSNVSAAITYSSCSPIIRYCYFIENERSAIGSGANVMGSPEIMHNILIRNTTDNSNRPQINLGPGAEDSLYIVGNYIEGYYDMAGGIGISNLMASGTTKAVIRSNYIVGNRYGFAQIGDHISAFIADNYLIDNNIQNEPNLGGSGLNFQGAANSNTAIVRRNYISGNLWGVTIQGTANPEFGTEYVHGQNVIFNNGNGGQTYALYNNTQKDVSAIGNYWGTNNPNEAENNIFHQPDQGNLGLVSYLPIHILEPVINLFMFSTIDNPGLEVDIYGEINQETHTIEVSVPASVDISNLIPQIGLELGVTSEPSGGIPTNFSEAVIYSISTPHGETAEYTVFVTTESETYILSFDIKNTIGETITDAVITLNGNENPQGHYVFENLLPGEYYYVIAHPEYDLVEGMVEISNQSVHLVIELSPLSYTLSFTIINEGALPIPDATISINDTAYEPGLYVFENMSPGNYTYTVSHPTYNTLTDNFEIINQDLTIEVILEEKVSLDEFFNSFRLYPQPLTNLLQISAAENASYSVSVFATNGKQLITKEDITGSVQLDLQQLEAGTYLLIINFQGKIHAEKIIKL